MSTFFKPYEGSRPFLFVSYAHRQSDAVVDTIRILHDKGYRLWYDEGIPAGSDWPANIAQHMQSCERVLFFLSARSMESPNCFSEMRTAVRLGKPMLVVRLEDAPVNENWQLLLADATEIPLLETPEARAEAILESGLLPRRFHRSLTEKLPWRALGFAAALLFFLAAAGALGALATGRWTPVQQSEPIVETPAPTPAATEPPAAVELGDAERFFAVSFPDSQQERAIRRALGVSSGSITTRQIAELTALYFCGNLVTDGLDAVALDENGVCRVNGVQVVTGQVSDLSLLSEALRLESLALICQPLNDVSALSGLPLLRELNLSGSALSSLSGLRELPRLETLHIEHTAIRDLTPLDAMESLKTVTVSRDMLPLTWSADAPFAVILVTE